MRAHSYRLGTRTALLGAAALAVAACGTIQAGNAPPGAASGRGATADAAASFTGATGWRVVAGSHRFELTSDGGSTWQSDSLPAAILVADATDISRTPGKAVVVAGIVGNTVKVAAQARPGATWSISTVTPHLPHGYRVASAVNSLMLTEAPDGFVGLVTARTIGMSTELVEFFSSRNGGASFTQVMSENTLIWRSVTFRSAGDGVAVEGPAGTLLYHTTNGGAKWTRAAVPKGLSTAEFSKPLAVAGGFLVAATTQEGSGAQRVVLLASSNGHTFSREGSPLLIPAKDNAGDVTVAAVTGSIWVFAGALFTYSDAGKSWTQVHAIGLPRGVVNVALTSPATASAVVATNSCKEYKSDCSTSEKTFITKDSGRTWSPQL